MPMQCRDSAPESLSEGKAKKAMALLMPTQLNLGISHAHHSQWHAVQKIGPQYFAWPPGCPPRQPPHLPCAQEQQRWAPAKAASGSY